MRSIYSHSCTLEAQQTADYIHSVVDVLEDFRFLKTFQKAQAIPGCETRPPNLQYVTVTITRSEIVSDIQQSQTKKKRTWRRK